MGVEPVFCDDLLEGILRKVPLKPRTRFKCVSKSWRDLITLLRHPSPSTTGLAFSFKKPCTKGVLQHQLTLLEVEDEICSIHSSIPHDIPWLIDSCNGLLLFGVKDGSSISYCVFSPMRKQWLQLPSAHDFLRPASASLAFDGVRHDFKVICHFWEEADTKNGTITCQIFSTKTWEWRECNARIHNAGLLLGKDKDFDMKQMFCPSLYRKRQVYWIWSIYLLVFDEKKDSFELMELPQSQKQSVYNGKRLWESEGGLNYCDSTDSGFYIWECADNSVHDKNREDCRLLWLPKHCIRFGEFYEFVSRSNEVLQISEISPLTVKPCAFNEDFEILYFQLRGIIAV